MTTDPVVSPAGLDAFAVTPVVDYEPPAHAVPRDRPVPPCRPSRRRGAHATRRPRLRPPPGALPAAAPADPGEPMSAAMRQAAVFADAALRRVLEVIDRRRPATQLRNILAPTLVDSVAALGRGSAPRRGAAVVRRMRVQPAGHRDPDTAAEVFGCYSRGDRIHAIACRVERVGDGARWQVVALHIG